MPKWLRGLAELIFIVVVAACNASLDDVSPPQPSTQVPTVPPTAMPTTVATADPRCPSPTEGTLLLAHEVDGYCFLYPKGLLRVDTSQHAVCLVPEGETQRCDNRVAAVEVTDAEGRTAAQIADERVVAGEGGFEPGRCTAPIAGIQTVVLTETGGQGEKCEMLFVREDHLYSLKFALPDSDDPPEVSDPLFHIFNTVTASFTLPPAVAAPSPAKGTAVVAYVQDGDLWVWSEATGQTQILVDTGDVIRVDLSDDGELAAFVRRSTFTAGGVDNNEQSALWVVGLDGSNPRELVSAAELRSNLDAAETDSTDFAELEWIPNSRRLLYNGKTYGVTGQGGGGVLGGVYLVDADGSGGAEIAPAEASHEFAASPDGGQVALVTPTGLSFYSFEGGRLRRDVLTYPAKAGRPFPFTPWGVWTQDSSAFLIAAPVETGTSTFDTLTVWRVPVEGAQPQALMTAVDISSPKVSFAPDGSFVAIVLIGPVGPLAGVGLRDSAPPLALDGAGGLFAPRFAGRNPDSATFILPLPEDLGPLATRRDTFGHQLIWSPGGSADVFDTESLRELYPLCPNASQISELCGPAIRIPLEIVTDDQGTADDDLVRGFEWVDGDRFLYVTIRPRQLYLGDLAGGTTLLAEDPASFDAVAATCTDDSEFVSDVTVPDAAPFEPGTVFRKTWRIRNSGSCTWDAGYRFAFLSGDRMSGPRSAPLGSLDRLYESSPLFPSVRPGEEMDVSVTLIAPSEEGTYLGEWQLFAPDGTPFGTRPYVLIAVP